MRTTSLLLACSVAAALVVGAPARAENLIDVYVAAVRSDPVLREAEARRMAALEAKPQARGLLLPQLAVTGEYATREGESTALFVPMAVNPTGVLGKATVGVTLTSAESAPLPEAFVACTT